MTHEVVKVTDLELAILQQIWSQSNMATVNSIIDRWPDDDKPGYTTILKTLQKMEAKEIVGHEKEGRKYSYFSKVSKERITKRRLSTIINRMFSGNKVSFAQHFINNEDFDLKELQELKELIARKEEEAKQ